MPESPKPKLKVVVKDVLGVAQWRWVANDDTCGICRVAFEACCPDCKFAGDDCPLGTVGPVFTLLPHPLHNEMAQRSSRTPPVPDVSPGVEVSRVDSELLSPLSLSYDSELPPLPESLSRLSLYDVPPRTKPEPARRKSPKPKEFVGSPKHIRQSPVPSEHSDKRPTEKPPVPPRKPSSVDLKLAHLRNEMASLRQMDLQLLSQLRQLNDSISSYRQELIMNMDSYSSSDTDGSDTTSVYSNVTPSSFDLSRSSTQSTPKRPPTSTDL